jgi:hypothetical protein
MPALKEAEPLVRSEWSAGRLFDPGGRRTLDDLLTSLLENASRTGAASCPVCNEPALHAAGEAALRCAACGSRLE